MGVNGRRVLALGEASGVRAPLLEAPLQLLLCNDVLLVTATGADGKHVLVRPPFPRGTISVAEHPDHWEDDVMEISDTQSSHGNVNCELPLAVAFASQSELVLWLQLLRNQSKVVETNQLTGARLMTGSARSSHELAVLLGVPDSSAKYGISELEKEYASVPKVRQRCRRR